jgi:chromosome segregation ATPase
MILKNIVVKNIELENKLKATQETFDNYHKLQMEDTAKQIGELQQQIRSLEYHLDRYEEELTHVSGR